MAGAYTVNGPSKTNWEAIRLETYWNKTNKIKNLKKNTKMKIYKTMIRTVVTYSSETWTVTAKDENNLRIFGRQILTHCGRVTQICVFNTVKLGTSASSP